MTSCHGPVGHVATVPMVSRRCDSTRAMAAPSVTSRSGDPTLPISLDEQIVSLTNATKLLPARRGNRPAHVSCMFRWAKHGLRGVKLETLRVGGTICTSKQALERFFSRLAELDGPDAETARAATPARRQREIAEASRKAEAALR